MNPFARTLIPFALVASVGVILLGPRRFVTSSSETAVRPRQAETPNQRAYRIGDRLPTFPGVEQSRSAQTFAVYLSTSCYYCISSMDFYRTLAKETGRSRGRFQLIVVGWEPAESLHRFVKQYGLEADRVVSLAQPDQKVRGTPTLVLANRDNVIRQVWVGKQPPAAQARILSLLRTEAG